MLWRHFQIHGNHCAVSQMEKLLLMVAMAFSVKNKQTSNSYHCSYCVQERGDNGAGKKDTTLLVWCHPRVLKTLQFKETPNRLTTKLTLISARSIYCCHDYIGSYRISNNTDSLMKFCESKHCNVQNQSISWTGLLDTLSQWRHWPKTWC